MPNWCANSLTLSATNKTTQLLLDVINQKMDTDPDNFGLLNFFIPVPEELNIRAGYPADPAEESNKEKYNYANWYDFCNSRWGTKWDANNLTRVDITPNRVIFTFDTAWSPPIPVYEKMAADGFHVMAGFVEQGCDYIGYYTSEDGYHSEEFDNFSKDLSEEERDNDDSWEKLTDMGESRLESFFDDCGIHPPQHTGG